MYDLTQEMCAAAGLAAYEVSNHARPGAECRHNLIYWRSGDYAAVGPGAHGRLSLGASRLATEARRAPGAWLNAVEAQGSGEGPRTELSPQDQAEEYLLMGLRLSEGVSLARLGDLGGVPSARRMDELEGDGFLAREGDRLRVTAKGRPLLNAILSRLV